MPLVKAFVSRTLTRLVTSPRLRSVARTVRAARRTLLRQPAQVHYFHQVDDPYSHLTALLLAALESRYRVQLLIHLVPPPPQAAAPDAARLRTWSARDATRLAAHLGLDIPDFSPHPDGARILATQCALAAHQPISPHQLAELSTAFWRGADTKPVRPEPVEGYSAKEVASAEQALEQGRALRQRLGHYLGATFWFEGEWYWGMDRLHYLEQRLVNQGLALPPTAKPLVPPPALRMPPHAHKGTGPVVIHFYLSLRSPYTWLAVAQVRRLAQHYGATLQLRFVLPMVMRGLPVPLEKRLYITRDTKREAERLGLPFGCIMDPVGTPTERGLAVLHRAVSLDKGVAFAESFLQGVFAEGVDAGSDTGLLHLARRAGLSQADVQAALQDESWRSVAEVNRQDMLERQLWGVPSFRVNDMPALWGQDRLWMLEQDLQQAQS